MSLERSWPERQLLSELAPEISSGEVVVLDDLRQVLQPLAGFPRLDLRIDWSHVEDSESLDGGKSATLLAEDSPLHAFWSRQRQGHDIEDTQRIIAFGDRLSWAVELSVEVFTRRMRDILAHPMHWFVFPAGAPWCFSYTMEGDAFFGLRPETLPRSWEETTLREDTRVLRQAGHVELVEESIMESLRQRFPVQDHRLDWPQTSGPTTLKPAPRQSFFLAEGDLEAMDQEEVGFWQEAKKHTGIADDEVLQVGGAQVEISLRLPAKFLDGLLPDVLSTLRETHILRLDPPWCMTFSAEGDAIYGKP